MLNHFTTDRRLTSIDRAGFEPANVRFESKNSFRPLPSLFCLGKVEHVRGLSIISSHSILLAAASSLSCNGVPGHGPFLRCNLLRREFGLKGVISQCVYFCPLPPLGALCYLDRIRYLHPFGTGSLRSILSDAATYEHVTGYKLQRQTEYFCYTPCAFPKAHA